MNFIYHKLNVLSSVFPIFFILFGSFTFAKENEMIEFDSAFFNVNDASLIQKFAYSNYVPSGVYPADLFVNGSFLKKVSLEVKEDGGKSRPCIDMNILNSLGIKESILIESDNLIKDCIVLEEVIVGSAVNFTMGMSKLDIQVPQIYLDKVVRGYVDPAEWERGISAAYISYDLFGVSPNDVKNFNAYFDSGININGWYFKHKGMYSWNEYTGEQYNALDSYLYRPVASIKGNVVLGKKNTNGRLFDTVPLLGMQIYDDQNMLADSQKGYAPEIFGVAKTNAIVKVEQNGRIIYETLVSPGEFLINDLYPTGYGGNLNVIILEADGTEQRFSVPYESMAQLLRPNTSRYSFSIGQYKNDRLSFTPMLIEGTYELGINNFVTGYWGGQANEDFLSLQGGLALGTSLGTFSFGGTQSYAFLDENYSGQSYELKYSKNIFSSGTNLSLGAYKYSTKEYMDYQTAMLYLDNIRRGYLYNDLYNSKNRYLVTVGQSFPEGYGNLYLSGVFENFWNETNYSRQYQVSYNNQYKRLSWGVSVSRNEDQYGQYQTNYALSLSIPLGFEGELRDSRVRLNLNRDSDGYQQAQVGLSDVVGEEKLLSYDVSVSNDESSNSFNGNASYVSPIAKLSANASKGNNYKSYGFGLSGTLVGHSGGVTLSPYSGNTFALVEAKGMEGATVSGYKGIKINNLGHAVVPNLRPYQVNHIHVDPNGTSKNASLSNTVNKTVPYDSAIVKLQYGTEIGFSILINSSFKGDALPFGADVIDENGLNIGNVAQGSIVFARTKSSNGILKVNIKNGEYCSIKYDVNKNKSKGTLNILNVDCI
ncbi:fimbrial biogenesis outer membrane usher protein [Shewanella sp. MR-4]|uniref:fimbria/pilus outer membrane usher protein n=1 Tax=Shewanella sp. (strain MR-4) TaxID=60480 RepID=UPI00005E567A|nr:fimbria/pilus outer membrane usher protein [Shewanella sp. MR-4]ABI39307.1 fimbrial biogenesis outer membrane usher protein [Shewanella sp. MR-4]